MKRIFTVMGSLLNAIGLKAQVPVKKETTKVQVSQTEISKTVNSKAFPKVENKAMPKVETKVIPKVETKAIPKVENKAIPKVETKAIPKVENR